jgi:RNA polymerase sigma factor (sigma-70 family)
VRYWGRDKRDACREVPAPAENGSSHGALLASYSDVLTPSRHASAREELERAERAMLALPDSYREVIILSRMVGLSHAEVAERMGRSTQAVWALYSRALARPATLLDTSRNGETG